ncbi:hypothetical protein [Periweissella ghanensis]|nr:hypothetical protein [Periweissella ghanensis]MCM0600989.1 hypothetical protein [Periweissella ghanensis]
MNLRVGVGMMNNIIGALAVLTLIGLVTYNYVFTKVVGQTLELQVMMFIVIAIVLGALIVTNRKKK